MSLLIKYQMKIKNLSDSIDKLKEANKGDDSQIINDAISAVNTTWQKISENFIRKRKNPIQTLNQVKSQKLQQTKVVIMLKKLILKK